MSWIDRLADVHFRQDPTGRLVFVPFSLKGICYFVESTAEEQQIRAFLNMYRIPNALISLMMTPMVMIPALILEDRGGLSPRGHRLTIALGISGFYWLSFVALALMLWFVYKAQVPGFTASLNEVSPEIKAQLSSISAPQRGVRRVALVCLFAGLVLMAVALLTTHGR